MKRPNEEIPPKSKPCPLVYVIILNYNGMRWVQGCFEALNSTKYNNFKLLLVDNNSSDGSVECVRANFPDVEIVVNKHNLGFCEGNNVGMRLALSERADYVILLNTDTKVTSNWLCEIVKVGEGNPNIGILGGIELDYSRNEFNEWTLQAKKKHVSEISNLETARQWIPTKWVHGSCFAIKRCVIEEIGMLDPIYFMYCEEIDFCRRAIAHGYEVALVPRCRYHHFGGGSSKGDRRTQFLVSCRLYRSSMIFHATDLTLSLMDNLLNYLKLLFTTGLTAIKERKFERIVLLMCLQPVMCRRSLDIVRKWKNDRLRMCASHRDKDQSTGIKNDSRS